MTKAQALKAAAARGFTKFDGASENGDNGPGSRLYYSRPDSPLNQYGAPLVYAQINRTRGKCWSVSYFGDKQ